MVSLLIFLLSILIPACTSSSPVFLMMYSAYKLNMSSSTLQKIAENRENRSTAIHGVAKELNTTEWLNKNKSMHLVFFKLVKYNILFTCSSCLTLYNPMGCSMPGFPVLHHRPQFSQSHVHLVGDVIQPSHLPWSPSLPAFNLSQHHGFLNESVLCIRWPKFWRFSFSISPSNEYPGLISFRIDWLDRFAVQGSLKNLLHHHSSKASILQLSAFFIVQLSHPYVTTGKTIALIKWTFVSKVMSLLLGASNGACFLRL